MSQLQTPKLVWLVVIVNVIVIVHRGPLLTIWLLTGEPQTPTQSPSTADWGNQKNSQRRWSRSWSEHRAPVDFSILAFQHLNIWAKPIHLKTGGEKIHIFMFLYPMCWLLMVDGRRETGDKRLNYCWVADKKKLKLELSLSLFFSFLFPIHNLTFPLFLFSRSPDFGLWTLEFKT